MNTSLHRRYVKQHSVQAGIDMSDIADLPLLIRSCAIWKNWPTASTLTADGDLQRLTWEVSRRETRTYNALPTVSKMSSEMQQGDWANSLLKGTVGGSFVASAKEAVV